MRDPLRLQGGDCVRGVFTDRVFDQYDRGKFPVLGVIPMRVLGGKRVEQLFFVIRNNDALIVKYT